MEHGHVNLLNTLKQLPDEQLKGKTLMEIGTVRENVPGQNSTEKFAIFCNEHNMMFVTVDMNQETIDRAAAVLHDINPKFSAVCSKGEDFLEDESAKEMLDNVDYIYLDAFDFNHGGHSKKRREDYQKYLGCDIRDDLCHQAHFLMAKNLIENWKPEIICWDDCWYSNGIVQGKGKSGVPFLLEQGWQLGEKWIMTPPK